MEPQLLCDMCVGITDTVLSQSQLRKRAKKARIVKNGLPYVWLGTKQMLACKHCRLKVEPEEWSEHLEWHRENDLQ